MTGPRQARPGERPRASRRADREGEDQRGQDRPSTAGSWRWGELSGSRGMLIVVAAAVLGAIATVVARTDPGLLLGAFILAGALVAGLAVRQRAAYLLIPVPVLAYLVFALAVGLYRSQSNPSKAGLTVSAAQWVADGFLIMIAATVVASGITGGRWFLARRAERAPAGRRRRGGPPRPEGRLGPEGRPEPEGRQERARSGPGRSSPPLDEARPQPEGRPRPAFRPNPDYAEWPGDRRPPPGPPSFGSSRDLTQRTRPRRVSDG